MLRDDRQAALNEVVRAALEAAHAHEQGAELLEDDASAAALRALAARRARAAAQLGEHLRRLGDLPKEPDADLETARQLLSRVLVALSDDRRDQILQHARHVEEHLATAVRSALEQDLPADTAAVLEAMLVAPEADAALGEA